MHYCGGQNLTGVALVKNTKACLDALHEYQITPSCIVMRGVSGMAVGMVLAAKLGCAYAVVRKPDEDTHSWRDIEGTIPGTGQVVIVDDFVAEGDTMVATVEAIRASGSEADGTTWNPHRDLTVLLYQQVNVPEWRTEKIAKLMHRVTYLPCATLMSFD
jgi:orotate phosphoribosyltransferase